jgi:D-3-phosphoglycerate dehydrogenase
VARILMEPISRALVVEAPDASLDDHLAAVGITPTRIDKVPDEAALIDALRSTGAQLLFKRSRVPVTRAVVAACPELHGVQLCCIGDDSVDKPACAEAGVLVFNDPVSNGRSVVELAAAHMIALSRKLFETDAAMHRHAWDKTASGRYEVLGKRLGVIGLGNIGRQVARLGEQLGMEIWFHDTRQVAQEVGVELGWRNCVLLQDLFRNVDIVTCHTSAVDAWGKDNAGLLDPHLTELGADRPASSPRLFINLARGNLHASDKLVAAVKSNRIQRAAVDVFPEEPRPGAAAWVNPYAEEPRIACTPHIGAATEEAQPRIARRVASTMEAFARWGSLRDCVYGPRITLSVADEARGHAVLAVVHSTARGTKKAVDDAIFEAEASNLGSTHRDFDNGVAYDLAVMDRPLQREELERLATRAADLAHDPGAIRAIRQIVVPAQGW